MIHHLGSRRIEDKLRKPHLPLRTWSPSHIHMQTTAIKYCGLYMLNFKFDLLLAIDSISWFLGMEHCFVYFGGTKFLFRILRWNKRVINKLLSVSISFINHVIPNRHHIYITRRSCLSVVYWISYCIWLTLNCSFGMCPWLHYGYRSAANLFTTAERLDNLHKHKYGWPHYIVRIRRVFLLSCLICSG